MQDAQFELHARVEERHWWFLGRRTIMRRVLAEVVPPGEGRIVIDVGCGTGGNIAGLAGDYETVGIDTSEPGITFARERFPDVRFVLGYSPDDLGDEAGRADALLLMDVLEHVEDDVGLLRAQVDAIKPGAFVLVTVPADMRLWSEHDVSFGHYRRYDVPMLRQVWADMPVREHLVSYFNTRLYPLVRAVRTVTRIRGRTFGAAGTDLKLPLRPVNRGLERFFAGESHRLIRRIGAPHHRGYRYGVSLIALLEKQAEATA